MPCPRYLCTVFANNKNERPVRSFYNVIVLPEMAGGQPFRLEGYPPGENSQRG